MVLRVGLDGGGVVGRGLLPLAAAGVEFAALVQSLPIGGWYFGRELLQTDCQRFTEERLGLGVLSRAGRPRPNCSLS